MRRAGLLAHVTSLPGPYGIGDLGPATIRVLDWLHEAGVGLWQVLPLHPTGAGGSPYSSPSAFAGNPLLISPLELVSAGWLAADEAPPDPARSSGRVDFAAVERWKPALLRRAHARFVERAPREAVSRLEAFVEHPAQRGWLEDWCRYAALSRRHRGAPWTEWPRELREREPQALARASHELATEIDHERWLQHVFAEQWAAVRTRAGELGIEILGDVPFYVAHDSADVWSHRELFLLEPDGRPRKVAGVPPDYFSAAGQLWGNPIYDWRRLAERDHAWWIDRLEAELRWADAVRLDHFRAFAGYWEVDAGAPDATVGRWARGPGRALFDALRRRLGRLPFVAEDLGTITDDVHELRRGLGLAGMAVLQFGMAEEESDYLPERHTRDLVVYTGTHDNDTTRGWFDALAPQGRRRVLKRLGTTPRRVVRAMVEAAWASVGELAVAPLQDVFELGSEARMNTPGRAADNWSWRADPHRFTIRRARWLAEVAKRTERSAGAPGPGRYTPGAMTSVSVDEIRQRIERALPGARVRVDTFSGSDHFSALVEAPQFRGKSLVEQHRLVYAAVDDLFGGAVHALALKTRPLDDAPASS